MFFAYIFLLSTLIFGFKPGQPSTPSRLLYPFGISVSDSSYSFSAGIGDVNNDGYNDFVFYKYNSVLLYFGSNNMSNPSYPNDASFPYGLNFTYATASIARISTAGDFNKDFYDDFLITDSTDRVHIVFGRPNTIWVQNTNLSIVVNTSFFQSQSDVGFHTNTLGDINNDSYTDIGMSDPYTDLGSGNVFGALWIVFGTASVLPANFDLDSLDGTNGFLIIGPQLYGYFGETFGQAGNFNGDAFNDFIVGAPYTDRYGNYSTGEAYLFFGKATWPSVIDLTVYTGAVPGAINITATSDVDYLAESVDFAGDVNGDGYDDIIIGSDYGDRTESVNDNAGRVYLIFGSATPPNQIIAEDWEADSNFLFIGKEASNLGAGVSYVGDVNQDGYDDIFVGAPFTSSKQLSNNGEAYLIFGGFNFSNFQNRTFDIFDIDGSNGIGFYGTNDYVNLGYVLSWMGDVNGDGHPDFGLGGFSSSESGTTLVFGNGSCLPGHRWNINDGSCIPCNPPNSIGMYNYLANSSPLCVFSNYLKNPLCQPQEYVQIIHNAPICAQCPSLTFTATPLGGYNLEDTNIIDACIFHFTPDAKCPSNHFVVAKQSNQYPNPTEYICFPCEETDIMINPVPAREEECKKFTCGSGFTPVFSPDGSTIECQVDPFVIIVSTFSGVAAFVGVLGYRYRQRKKNLKIEYRDIDFNQNTTAGGFPLANRKNLRVNVLTLDGGGIRAIVSLGVLDEIEKRFGGQISQMFHLIGGTSTGGLIALAFGQERLGISQMQKLYEQLGKKVFVKQSNFIKFTKQIVGSSFYSAELFTKVLKQIFGSDMLYSLDRDIPFPFTVSISTLTSMNPPTEFLFRNYVNNESRYFGSLPDEDWTIWEAARCTSAAPIFFAEHSRQDDYDNRLWSDGALFHNNPSKLVLKEARQVFPFCTFGVFISVGTGKVLQLGNSANKSSMGWLKTMTEILTNSERTHSEMQDFLTDGEYFRFNVPFPQPIPIDASQDDDIEIMNMLTAAYISAPKYVPLFDACTSRFHGTFSLLNPSLSVKIDSSLLNQDQPISFSSIETQTPQQQIESLREQIKNMEKHQLDLKRQEKTLQLSFTGLQRRIINLQKHNERLCSEIETS